VTEPIPVDAAGLFDFLGGAGLKVLLISLHRVHTFNRVLSRQLAVDHETIALGTIDLYELVATGGPGLRFLHQGLRDCGAPASFGVLPGYCLFRGTEMLAWDAGLPVFADVEAMARSALLGAIWSGVTRDITSVGQALHAAAEQLAGERVAARFRSVAAERETNRRASATTDAPPVDELFWAYQVLGVLPAASDREVHDAWQRRRKEHHPDLAAGDAAEFDRRSRISADINRARDIIVAHRSGQTRRAS